MHHLTPQAAICNQCIGIRFEDKAVIDQKTKNFRHRHTVFRHGVRRMFGHGS